MRDEMNLFSNMESGHLEWDKLKRKYGHLEWDGGSMILSTFDQTLTGLFLGHSPKGPILLKLG